MYQVHCVSYLQYIYIDDLVQAIDIWYFCAHRYLVIFIFASIFLTQWGMNIHSTDSIFWCIFLNENIYVLIKISLKFVPEGPFDNIGWWLGVEFVSNHYMNQCWPRCLARWGRDKMTAIFQTTFSNAFSWMKIYQFWLWFHRNLFPRVLLVLIIFYHWFI